MVSDKAAMDQLIYAIPHPRGAQPSANVQHVQDKTVLQPSAEGDHDPDLGVLASCKMAADSGMDTCPSPENADSRKRPLDSDVEDATAKKSNCSSGKSTKIRFLILTPCPDLLCRLSLGFEVLVNFV